MIIPIITAVVRDVLMVVPDTQRDAALALGATPWEKTRIVLENATSGIAGAVVLGLGRALGETMAVTMVIGNSPQISSSIFDPAYSIASVLAANFAEATDELYLSALIEMGLVLFLVTMLVNAVAKLLVMRVERGWLRNYGDEVIRNKEKVDQHLDDHFDRRMCSLRDKRTAGDPWIHHIPRYQFSEY